jgi:transposase
MTAALVERMAPEDLWELFQRVVPPAPVRPQGGGHRRRGDHEVLAAIIFVATSGCTWNQLAPWLGLSGVTAFRRFTECTEARVWAKLHRLVLAFHITCLGGILVGRLSEPSWCDGLGNCVPDRAS